MHWSEEIAQRSIDRDPDKEEYVCAAGTSPSGSVHIGNFRDVATPLFVVKALQKKGKKARLLLSWDDYDRCRKIPANFEDEYLRALKRFGIEIDCRYQADLYRSGAYTKDILEALQKRKEIFEILDSFKTKDPDKTP